MLTSKQRAQLRALANTEDAIFQVGKGGVNENLKVQIDDALEARELIKVRVLETAGDSAKAIAVELAEACGADVVQVIGTKFVLYRQSTTKKTITLVK